MSFKVVTKELQKSVRHYDNEANRVLELEQNEYEYNRNTLMRDKFADAIKILTDASGTGENNCNLANVSKRSELLAFKRLISKTPLAELECYSDEEFTDFYLKANSC